MIGSEHQLWATTSSIVKTDLPEWLQPFAEGLTGGSSSSTDVSPADVGIPPPALPPFRASSSKTCFEQVSGKALFIHSFSERPEGDARNLRECHAEEILTIGWTELTLPKDLAM